MRLPAQPQPLGITPSGGEVELGRKLFFDKRLSLDGTVSCSSCHDPKKGWSDGLPLAVGINGRIGNRHSPTIINAAWSAHMFWDGRTIGTPTQSLLPLSNPDEMGQQTEGQVIAKLRLIPEYVALFTKLYAIDPAQGSAITGVNLARAFAAFETTIVSVDAPIHRRLAGDENALTPDAEIGFKLFKKANCMDCHVPPLFTDHLFHNNGMEHAGKYRVTDQGRYNVIPAGTRSGFDMRAFKTPTLMEIQRSAPYNHAGNFADLKRVLLHYNAGGARFDKRTDPNKDVRIKPLGLNATQLAYFEVFMKEAFAGKNYPMIEEP